MRNSKNIVFGMLALVVSVIAIGLAYAGFTGTLNVNGTGNVVSSKWDIYFNNLSNAVTTGTANVVTPATISPKTKIGDYYVELASPGDSVIYTFDVVNDGDFDAVLTTLTKSTPTCTPSASLCNYLSYTLKYTSNNIDVAENDKLLVGETKNMTLKLTLDPNMPASALSSTELSVSDLGITLLYSQDSSYGGNPQPYITYVNRQNAGQITTGDEVAIDSEHFYVITPDDGEGNTVLLAKYNLLVGDVFEQVSGTWSKIKTYQPSDSGYGLQSSIAKGYYSGGNDYTGVVAFSGKGYWDNANCVSNGNGGNTCPGTVGLKSEYANASNAVGTTSYVSTYPYVYRSSMSTIAPSHNGGPLGEVQDNGYTIAYYVEEYVNKLKEDFGASQDIEGRLLTYEEANSLNSTIRGNWSYWLGSARSQYYVRDVGGGRIGGSSFWYGPVSGVRPVITVSTSEI